MTTNRLKVLIVEDEPLIRVVLREKLLELGLDVCAEAGSGLEAIAISETVSPDLILMDFQLSGQMNGLQVMQRIRKTKITPAIFITGYGDPATLFEMKSLTRIEIVIKPVDDAKLKRAIITVLA